MNDRIKREGVQTHKERVEGLNRYLSALSEHHDMYGHQVSVVDVCGALTLVKAEDWAWVIFGIGKWQVASCGCGCGCGCWIGWDSGVGFGTCVVRRHG